MRIVVPRLSQQQKRASMSFGPNTRYIISTSGRPSSMRRYARLFQLCDLDIAYIPISSGQEGVPIKPEDFVAAMRGLKALGGAISKDIKGSVVPHLDAIDGFAKNIGSVNTLVWWDGKLTGFNTDAHGFGTAIIRVLDKLKKPVKNAIVYGYGGVFSVVYYSLRAMGIEVAVTGRDSDKVAARVREFGLKPYDGRPRDLFVNTAPVTDRPLAQAEGFLDALQGARVVFDHEMPGQYLADYAAEQGIHHIPGTDMYWPQMERQWELFLSGLVRKEEIPALLRQAEAESA